MTSVARDAVISAARKLFSERGYSAVTIKDVAASAGYSPAMVMKVAGSKAALYAEATVVEGPQTIDSSEPTGFYLVRRIVNRWSAGEAEPWASLAMRVTDAPDKEAELTQIHQKYLTWLRDHLGAEQSDRAEDVMVTLVGLATGLRVLGLHKDLSAEELIRRYGARIQRMLDHSAEL